MRGRRLRDCSRERSIPKINTEERVLDRDNLLAGLIDQSFKKSLANNNLSLSFNDITDFQHVDSSRLRNAKCRLVFHVNGLTGNLLLVFDSMTFSFQGQFTGTYDEIEAMHSNILVKTSIMDIRGKNSGSTPDNLSPDFQAKTR